MKPLNSLQRMVRITPCLCIAALLAAAPARSDDAQAAAVAEFSLEAIAEGVHVHHGAHRSVEDPEREDIANLGVIIGSRCVAVVDTGGSIRIGSAFRAAIAKLTALPVCYVINTHVHFDHVLGNAAFVSPETAFVGHANLAEAMAENQSFFGERFATELKTANGPAALVGPTVLVTEQGTELDLGGRLLRLKAVKTAHSSQDLTVLDVQTGTLFLGDLLFMERVPTLDGNLIGWLAVLTEWVGVAAERVVPGHGPVQAPWPAAALDETRYLTVLRDGVREAIKAGTAMEAAGATVGRAEREHWLLFDRVHPRNVLRAYTELEWE